MSQRTCAGVSRRCRAGQQEAREGWSRADVGVTNRSLRRTFASLLYEAGTSPSYVIGQMGHTSASIALKVYRRLMSRDRDTAAVSTSS